MPTATSAPTSPPPPPPTEPALGTVRLSPAAFYDAHVTRIYAYFLRRVPDAATAEDLTAVTFERLAAAWPAFVPRGDGDIAVRVWAYRAATNVLRNAWRDGTRRAARDTRWAAAQPASTDPRADVERRVVLDQALAALAPDDRDLLGLRFWDDLSAPEIAAVLDLSQREVYTRIDRCLRQLKRQIDAESEVKP